MFDTGDVNPVWAKIPPDAISEVSAMIRAAVLKERERCAEVAATAMREWLLLKSSTPARAVDRHVQGMRTRVLTEPERGE